MEKVKVKSKLGGGLEKQRRKTQKNYMTRVKKRMGIPCGKKDQKTSKGSQK